MARNKDKKSQTDAPKVQPPKSKTKRGLLPGDKVVNRHKVSPTARYTAEQRKLAARGKRPHQVRPLTTADVEFRMELRDAVIRSGVIESLPYMRQRELADQMLYLYPSMEAIGSSVVTAAFRAALIDLKWQDKAGDKALLETLAVIKTAFTKARNAAKQTPSIQKSLQAA